MKFSPVYLLTGLCASAIATPAPKAPIAKRTTNFADIFAEVDAHAAAALDICASANVDINADIDVRAEVAAQLKADLDACAALLAEAAAEIKASTAAEIDASNGGCDAGCVETVVVEKSTKFCEDVNVVVETLGEDACAEYVEPAMVSFGEFATCVDGIFVGVGAAVQATVEATLGAALSASLGLDLSLGLGLGLGGLIGVGR